MKRYILILSVVTLFLSLNSPVLGADIQYGQVEDVHGSEVHLKYKGPSGEESFICDVVKDDCESLGTSTPSLFPEIEGEEDYNKSPSGKYGIIKDEVEAENGSSTYMHKVYDISGDEAQLVELVPYFKDTSSYKFAWGEEHVMLFGVNGDVITFNIETAEISEMDPDQSEFSMRSVSPFGSYLSSYDYEKEEHHIWDSETGEVQTVPSETPNFVEFSQDEKFAAFVEESEGYKTMHLVDLERGRAEPDTERVFDDNFTVDDYIFFKNDLYVVGNTADDPYNWVLYRVDTDKMDAEIVAEDISYASYMRPAGDHGLLFLQIDGKNTNVGMYVPESRGVKVLEAVDPSPSSSKIERSVVSFDRGMGVLYEPEYSRGSSDLFIWLHGGPRRQTSFGYHSYLSYAVYDELLERLVDSGAYVLKLDYSGSFGHGSDLTDALMNELGVADRDDVVEATREMQRRFRIDRTYLIGNSYGGYLGPKALVDKSEIFDGAVAINGVFDWFTLLERIPSSPFSVYFDGLAELGDLEENYDMYKEASVYKGLPDLEEGKMLLIYGEDDSTVPVWQTREFFYLADSLGNDVELLKLEGEGHIIRQRENLDLMCEFIAEGLSIDDLECN
ncbi:MAG: prolyl oligopeptidase family serine peptidase [Patescibacteria group bacterium]